MAIASLNATIQSLRAWKLVDINNAIMEKGRVVLERRRERATPGEF
ncbi:MAG: hypothetical protein ACTSU5_01065 [Promethearchaeota archaeon]